MLSSVSTEHIFLAEKHWHGGVEFNQNSSPSYFFHVSMKTKLWHRITVRQISFYLFSPLPSWYGNASWALTVPNFSQCAFVDLVWFTVLYCCLLSSDSWLHYTSKLMLCFTWYRAFWIARYQSITHRGISKYPLNKLFCSDHAHAHGTYIIHFNCY